jgi:hypothetical protein
MTAGWGFSRGIRMRKCYLHVGRHKTGTSAIQAILYRQRERLNERGYLYPQSGSLTEFFGHHNIAWEILKYSAFDPAAGGIEDLTREIAASPHHVVISSEDFSTAIRSFGEFRSFVRRLKDCGLAVEIICYFRNPHDYLRSAYLEVLKHGCPLGFTRFLTGMLNDETMKWDYGTVGGRDTLVEGLRQLERDGDAKIIARSYDRVSEHAVADFLSILGLTLRDLGEDELRLNEASGTEQSLTRLFQNTTGRAPSDAEQWLIRELGQVMPASSMHMSEPAWRQVAEKYETDLAVLQRSFGVKFAKLSRTGRGIGENSPTLEEVFSAVIVRAVQAAGRPIGSLLDERVAGVVEELRAERNRVSVAFSDLTARHDSVAESYAIVADRHGTLATAYRELVADHINLAKAHSDLVASHTTIAAAHADLTSRHGELVEAREALGRSHDGSVNANEQLAVQRDQIATQRDELATQRDQLAAQCSQIAAQRDDLAAQFDRVLASRSWRLTNPLRRLYGGIARRD